MNISCAMDLAKFPITDITNWLEIVKSGFLRHDHHLYMYYTSVHVFIVYVHVLTDIRWSEYQDATAFSF